MTDRIKVAAAVIVNSNKETLVSLRHQDTHQGGKWEFPGGKFEVGENAEQALVRELREELGIDVLQTEPFLELQYHYPEKIVELFVLNVIRYEGNPRGLEGQRVDWTSREQLEQLTFPDANYPILEKLLKLLSE